MISKNREGIMDGPMNMRRRTIIGFSVLLLLGSPGISFAAIEQDVFPTPEKAVDALVYASRHNHTTELLNILGPLGKKLIHSGDDIADEAGRQRFVAAYDIAHKLEIRGDGAEILSVGQEEWPLPIPLVHNARGWIFDTDAGDEEILNRRIGKNELNVIEVCRAYVEAQMEYAAQHPLPNDQHEYAKQFLSTAGRHDGLYWPVNNGEPESPFGPLIAKATAEGYLQNPDAKQAEPYHGYYYKILMSQGIHAAGGGKDYVTDGHMAGGFALLAFPATYGDSGVATFIVNQNGIVYEKNLGPDTLKAVSAINEFDPDESWTVVR